MTLKLSAFNPAPENWSPDDDPDAVFEIVALPGLQIAVFNDLYAAGRPLEAARHLILAGVKSISGVTDADGKEITNARELWKAMQGADMTAAALMGILTVKIVAKSALTKADAKNL